MIADALLQRHDKLEQVYSPLNQAAQVVVGDEVLMAGRIPALASLKQALAERLPAVA